MTLMDEAIEATLSALIDEEGLRPGADTSFELELLEAVNPDAALSLAERLHDSLWDSRHNLIQKSGEVRRISALAESHPDWKPSSYVWSSARVEMIAKILEKNVSDSHLTYSRRKEGGG
jgi:hypothetical protein